MQRWRAELYRAFQQASRFSAVSLESCLARGPRARKPSENPRRCRKGILELFSGFSSFRYASLLRLISPLRSKVFARRLDPRLPCFENRFDTALRFSPSHPLTPRPVVFLLTKRRNVYFLQQQLQRHVSDDSRAGSRTAERLGFQGIAGERKERTEF
jgi:hypothetical protein